LPIDETLCVQRKFHVEEISPLPGVGRRADFGEEAVQMRAAKLRLSVMANAAHCLSHKYGRMDL
jgi:hypothetical protein